VVNDLALDFGLPHDLCLDDFLHLHLAHQFPVGCDAFKRLWGRGVTESNL
jgi:hypothetical protein